MFVSQMLLDIGEIYKTYFTISNVTKEPTTVFAEVKRISGIYLKA